MKVSQLPRPPLPSQLLSVGSQRYHLAAEAECSPEVPGLLSAAFLPHSSQDLRASCFKGPAAAATIHCYGSKPLLPWQ